MSLFDEKSDEAIRTKNYEITNAEIISVSSWLPRTYVSSGDEEHIEPGVISLVIRWSCKYIGFGEISLRQEQGGKVTIHAETMGKEFCQAVLAFLAANATIKV